MNSTSKKICEYAFDMMWESSSDPSCNGWTQEQIKSELMAWAVEFVSDDIDWPDYVTILVTPALEKTIDWVAVTHEVNTQLQEQK